jgi:hypothetical protein
MSSNDKKDNPYGVSKKETQEIFESEAEKEGTIINSFYTKLLETAHPATKSIVKNQMIDAMHTAFQVRDMLAEADDDPEKKAMLMSKINSMQNRMASNFTSPGEDLHKEHQKDKKDK